MALGRFLSIFFTALCFCTSLAYAEFPPDTFPPDESGSNESYEESESKAAEDEYLSPKRRRQPPRPRPAPQQQQSTPARRERVTRQALPEPEKPGVPYTKKFRVWALMGLSTHSSAFATHENSLATLFLKENFGMGLIAEAQFSKLLGAEIEGYYAFTPLQEVEFGNPGDANYHIETRKMTHWGTMAHARVEYCFTQEFATFCPRLGAGLGLHYMDQLSGNVPSSPDGNQASQVLGGFLLFGMEAALGQNLLGFLDYSVSVGARGTFTETGTAQVEEGIAGPTFSRLRVGMSVKTLGLRLGGLFVLRGLNAPVSARANLYFGQGDQILQFMALVGYDF